MSLVNPPSNYSSTAPKKMSYKERHSFRDRVQEVRDTNAKFPNKIPVIVEKAHKEKVLPDLEKTKFLVPKDITVCQFISIIRGRLSIPAAKTFYLLINNKSLSNMHETMYQVHHQEADPDGFLYVQYASQEMFGSASLS